MKIVNARLTEAVLPTGLMMVAESDAKNDILVVKYITDEYGYKLTDILWCLLLH